MPPASAGQAPRAARRPRRAPSLTRSIPSQQNSIARSRTTSRGTCWWSCHQLPSAWIEPGEQLRVRLERQRALTGVALGVLADVRVGGHELGDDADRLLLDAGDRVGDLRVGRVAEERLPGVAVLLDERQERVDPAAQPLLPRGPGLGVRLQPAEDLGRVRVDELGVQLALGREVLVDQRLGDARRLRDLLERRAVVARPAEDLARRRQQLVAALGRAEAATRAIVRVGHARSIGLRP